MGLAPRGQPDERSPPSPFVMQQTPLAVVQSIGLRHPKLAPRQTFPVVQVVAIDVTQQTSVVEHDGVRPQAGISAEYGHASPASVIAGASNDGASGTFETSSDVSAVASVPPSVSKTSVEQLARAQAQARTSERTVEE